MFPGLLDLTLKSIELSDCIKNGFICTELCSFNSETVSFDVFSKNTKQKSAIINDGDETKTFFHYKETTNISSNYTQLLKEFEETVLTPELLCAFNKNRYVDVCQESLNHQSIFNYWNKLKLLSGI